MSERFKEHAWNACVGQLTESSNLSTRHKFDKIYSIVIIQKEI